MTTSVDTAAREQEQPMALVSGMPGKCGFLQLGFELDSSGRSILREWQRRAPLIVQQALYFDERMPEMPCVYILSSGGPHVDGDRYEQNITVHRDAFAHISTGASTKLAEMRYDHSELRQRFTLEEGAYMEFLPEPVIPCRHTKFYSETDITVAPSATLFYSEIYTSGRKHSGERFEYDILSVCTRVRSDDCRPLMREKFVIEPHVRKIGMVGAMNGYDVMANITVLTPKKHADRLYDSFEVGADAAEGITSGITRLPSDAGLLVKVLGRETAPVKRAVRAFCSAVRKELKGRELPEEFPWR